MLIKQHTTPTHSHTHMQSHTTHLSIAPSDYDALTGFLLGPFSDSVRQLSFNVSIVNDAIPEDDEDFTGSLTLLPADQTRLGNRVTVDPDLVTVTILDDDGTIPVILTRELEMCFPRRKIACISMKVHVHEIAHDGMVFVNATCMQFVFQ